MTPEEFAARLDAIQAARVANEQMKGPIQTSVPAQPPGPQEGGRSTNARQLRGVRFADQDVSVSHWSCTDVMMLVLALCFVLLHCVDTPEVHALACKAAGDWGFYTCAVHVQKSAFEKVEEDIQQYGDAVPRVWKAASHAWDLVYSEGDFTTSLMIADKYLVPTEAKHAAALWSYACKMVNNGDSNFFL
jgi:hypothetical protein